MKLEVLLISASDVSESMIKQIKDARNEDSYQELIYGSHLMSIYDNFGYLVALIDSDADILLGTTILHIDKRPDWLSADLPMIEEISVRKREKYDLPVIDYIVDHIVEKLREGGYKKLYVETDERQALHLVSKGFDVSNFGIVVLNI